MSRHGDISSSPDTVGKDIRPLSELYLLSSVCGILYRTHLQICFYCRCMRLPVPYATLAHN